MDDGLTWGYIPPELVEKAREMDLLTYLQTCEPHELVRVSGHEYSTRTHDSLKISNGKWMWWSRGVGGKNAVDYLVTVKGMPFYRAVKTILDYAGHSRPPNSVSAPAVNEKHILLPRASPDNDAVITYLMRRGIAENIIHDCIRQGLIYEDEPEHRVVFVGFNENHEAKYAGVRAREPTGFKGDAYGSDKAYSFRLENPTTETVHVFEGAIDLLSYATLLQMWDLNYRDFSLVSLAGVFNASQKVDGIKVPAALAMYLKQHPQTKTIALHLDRDIAGVNATRELTKLLSGKYEVRDCSVSWGKDVNDFLCHKLNLPITKSKNERSYER